MVNTNHVVVVTLPAIEQESDILHNYKCSPKTAFCLGEKEGMLVNVECSSWYNRIGNFLYQFGIGENSIPTDQHA